ncbi:Hsp70-binding protein 1 [Mactra antiquata]
MSSASGSGDGSGRQPRMPKDVKGLLKFCAETASSGQGEDTLEPMSAERREWLEKAINDMTVSPVEEMKKCIEKIKDDKIDDDDKIEALETLTEWCEHIDFAIDFHKIGGFVIFPLSFNSDDAEIRWQCLEVIASLVQMNPYCQAAVLQEGLLPVMLKILDTDNDPTVKTKALYALSCLTRECTDALEQFISNDGFSYIMRAMQTDISKLKIKSAFMLSSICTDNNKCKDTVCDTGMIDQLVGHLSEEHSNFHEHLLSALLTIVRDHPRSLDECGRSELNLVSTLLQKQQDLKGKEEYQEELQYATELLGLLNTSNNTEQEAAR